MDPQVLMTARRQLGTKRKTAITMVFEKLEV